MDDPIQSDLSGIIIGGGIPDEDPIIPNVFSPNGDGKNDYFTVGGIDADLVSDFSLRVFNRWGQQVASTTNVKGWNGRSSGDEAPDGVYYFFMDLAYEARGCGGELIERKQLETQKGWVQVLR
jgi:gliding motility-associated-like protein